MQEHGAAYETGGLEVGQLILEVDGNKVEGMHHQVRYYTLIFFYNILMNFYEIHIGRSPLYCRVFCQS